MPSRASARHPSARAGCVHDERDADEAHERAGDVPPVGPKAVGDHAPPGRADEENATGGGEDAPEVRVGLEGGDEAVEAERDDACAGPDPAPVLPPPLPDEPGT